MKQSMLTFSPLLDCGLKTRKWDEVKGALTHMVNAAKFFREQNKA